MRTIGPDGAAVAGASVTPHRPLGKEIGRIAVNAYERGVADVVALEKEAAAITRPPWAKSALTLHAGLLEDIGAAYVRTARAALR
ncbi:hypothetical protein [Spirilliplanes yamanashiensis]|uniref:hypothetical protein n=1 Tax=Spirilliplanes yamanashiensis TaxID=42233 RepID=UPI0019513A09|nr:hypothetical protein [Spirilliplanes yamanashiensis]MDP9818320.1 hypothetical protein [Spirilliplanes yamanashiensis]